MIKWIDAKERLPETREVSCYGSTYEQSDVVLVHISDREKCLYPNETNSDYAVAYIERYISGDIDPPAEEPTWYFSNACDQMCDLDAIDKWAKIVEDAE